MENDPSAVGNPDARRFLRGKFDWESAEKQKKDPASMLNAVIKLVKQSQNNQG